MYVEAVAPDGMGGSNLTPESGMYGGDMAAGMYGDMMAAGAYGYNAPAAAMVATYTATIGYGGCALPTNAHLMPVV